MAIDFVINAEVRDEQGTSASRRLRRTGWVPTIMYGGGEEPVKLKVKHNVLYRQLQEESFYSHILTINTPDGEASAVLKDLQRHPYRDEIMHMDLMRIVRGQAMRMTVPLHFVGEATAPGIKDEGGILDRMRTELDIECLPKDLPEYLEVDISKMALNDSLHLQELETPEGITVIDRDVHDENYTLVAIHMPRAVVDEDPETDDVAADEVPASEQAEGEDGAEDSED